jgi:hypothetical protein
VATPPLSREKHAEIIRLTRMKWPIQKIADAIGVGTGTVHNYKDRPLPETHEMSTVEGNQWNISIPQTRIQTLEQLIEHCKIDLNVWEVERFTCNKWEASTTTGEGDDRKVVTTPMFQVKATCKRKVEVATAREEIEALKEKAKNYMPAAPKVVKPKTSGYMLEVNIPDAHFGKLAWGEETGWENYDTKIADELFERAFETLLARTSGYEYDEALFILGNDYFQTDNTKGQTFAGTQVSSDGRYQKTFEVGRDRAIACIERLRTIAKKVKVIIVPGNHDTLSAWHLGDSLYCWFHKYKDVEIDNAPKMRKYHQFGKVGLCFTHGDKGKKDKYPLLMATEDRRMFGETKFNEIHTGHLHKTQLDEHNGIRVRVLPALCSADQWHAEMGFTGNQRAAEAYIWSREEGLVGTAIFTA